LVLQIYQLFDLIIGSGVGGIVALAVGAKKVDVQQFEKEFNEYLHRVFQTNIFTKLSPAFKHKFSSNCLIEETKRLFGSTLLSGTLEASDSPAVHSLFSQS
jgi:patatin-like phospholipase/acyl hydrolase